MEQLIRNLAAAHKTGNIELIRAANDALQAYLKE